MLAPSRAGFTPPGCLLARPGSPQPAPYSPSRPPALLASLQPWRPSPNSFRPGGSFSFRAQGYCLGRKLGELWALGACRIGNFGTQNPTGSYLGHLGPAGRIFHIMGNIYATNYPKIGQQMTGRGLTFREEPVLTQLNFAN